MRATADDARAHLADTLMRVGGEDRTAFRELYRLTSAKLFGITLRICGDHAAAEEVLSEVYLIVWRRAGAWEPGRASPITWLATLARNRAIDWRRAQGRHQLRPLDEAVDIIDPTPDAEDQLITASDHRTLIHCLSELEERQRSAIRRAFYDGYTYADVAAQQGVPLGTVKSWVRRGLMRLSKCIRQSEMLGAG